MYLAYSRIPAVEPTLAMTSTYALTNFEVQYWDNSAWATVPGGSITINNRVWCKFSFTPLTTSKIRVHVTNVAGDNRSQVVELEAILRNIPRQNAFTQTITRNGSGYLFRNAAGEEVRIMSRGGGWDFRVRNASGNYLDEFGNVGSPASTHGITVKSQ